mgnify:CR=1 FL=1|jgi:TPP-dependent trihydroxycyclohexane-1,2-dione (THcHDO) dehydratase
MTSDDRDTPYVLEPVSPEELHAAATATTGDSPSPISVVLGTNLAYEAVSLSTANVVQDIGTMVRQFTAVSTAAIAVATEKLLEATAKKDVDGMKDWMTAVADVTYNLDAMAKVYGDFGAYAAIVKGYFLPGAAVPPAPTPPTPPTPPSLATPRR